MPLGVALLAFFKVIDDRIKEIWQSVLGLIGCLLLRSRGSAPIYILMRIEASKADASSEIRVNRTSKRKGHRVAVFENKSYSVKFPMT